MSKRTQFRNDHKHRSLPAPIAVTLNTAQTMAVAEPKRRKELLLNAFAGCLEWWKYKRLRNTLLRINHKPHQGKQECARRVTAAFRRRWAT